MRRISASAARLMGELFALLALLPVSVFVFVTVRMVFLNWDDWWDGVDDLGFGPPIFGWASGTILLGSAGVFIVLGLVSAAFQDLERKMKNDSVEDSSGAADAPDQQEGEVNVERAPYPTLTKRMARGECLQCGEPAEEVQLVYGISLLHNTVSDTGNAVYRGSSESFLPRGRIGVPFCDACADKHVKSKLSDKAVEFVGGWVLAIFAAICLAIFLWLFLLAGSIDDMPFWAIVLLFGAVLGGGLSVAAIVNSKTMEEPEPPTEQDIRDARDKVVCHLFRRRMLRSLNQYFPEEDPHYLVFPDAPYDFESQYFRRPPRPARLGYYIPTRLGFGEMEMFRERLFTEDVKMFKRSFIDSTGDNEITYAMGVVTEADLREKE